jgi:hypothetical protein
MLGLIGADGELLYCDRTHSRYADRKMFGERMVGKYGQLFARQRSGNLRHCVAPKGQECKTASASVDRKGDDIWAYQSMTIFTLRRTMPLADRGRRDYYRSGRSDMPHQEWFPNVRTKCAVLNVRYCRHRRPNRGRRPAPARMPCATAGRTAWVRRREYAVSL